MEEDASSWNPYFADQQKGRQTEAANMLFRLKSGLYAGAAYEGLFSEMVSLLREFRMSHFYRHAMRELGRAEDASLLQEMDEFNQQAISALDATTEKDKNYAGSSDVIESAMKKLEIYVRMCDFESATTQLSLLTNLNLTTGQRMECLFNYVRLAFYYHKEDIVESRLAELGVLVEASGDWSSKNQFKIYRALQSLGNRNLQQANDLLAGAISTFCCYDLMSLETYMFYTLLSSVLYMDRPRYKKEVLTNPEVLSCTSTRLFLSSLCTTLYHGKYRDFMAMLIPMREEILKDPSLAPHCAYILRELRIRAYSQFLKSYQTFQNMSEIFGLSVPLLDKELSYFTSANRVEAKIDKVDGLIVSHRKSDSKRDLEELLEKSDKVLTRIQLLTRILGA